MSLDRGDVVGRHFEVERLLASHFGYNAYRARHILLGKPVALKVLVRSKSEWAAPFFDAASHIEELEPGAMVSCLGQGSAGRANRFFAFEWVTGDTLAEHIGRPLERNRVLEVGAEVAGALAQLHAGQLWHGSVRPNRIVMSKKGPRLLDPIAPPSEDLRAVNAVYSAPERFAGDSVGHPAVDVYALGTTLYHAISGAPPYVGETLVAVMLRILFDVPDPLPASVGHLRPWIAGMLSPRPLERPRAQQIEEAFRAEIDKRGGAKFHPMPSLGSPVDNLDRLRALALVRSRPTMDEGWRQTVSDLGGTVMRLVEGTTLVRFGSDCPRDPAASVLELTRRTREIMPRAAVVAGVVEEARALRALLDQMAALIAKTPNGTLGLHASLERSEASDAPRKGGTLEIDVTGKDGAARRRKTHEVGLDSGGGVPLRGPSGTLVLEPEVVVEQVDTVEVELPAGIWDLPPDGARPPLDDSPTPRTAAEEEAPTSSPTVEIEVDQQLIERSRPRASPSNRGPRKRATKWSPT